jgi:hypothetical protein
MSIGLVTVVTREDLVDGDMSIGVRLGSGLGFSHREDVVKIA